MLQHSKFEIKVDAYTFESIRFSRRPFVCVQHKLKYSLINLEIHHRRFFDGQSLIPQFCPAGTIGACSFMSLKWRLQKLRPKKRRPQKWRQMWRQMWRQKWTQTRLMILRHKAWLQLPAASSWTYWAPWKTVTIFTETQYVTIFTETQYVTIFTET